jgi:hypothetical protein
MQDKPPKNGAMSPRYLPLLITCHRSRRASRTALARVGFANPSVRVRVALVIPSPLPTERGDVQPAGKGCRIGVSLVRRTSRRSRELPLARPLNHSGVFETSTSRSPIIFRAMPNSDQMSEKQGFAPVPAINAFSRDTLATAGPS